MHSRHVNPSFLAVAAALAACASAPAPTAPDRPWTGVRPITLAGAEPSLQGSDSGGGDSRGGGPQSGEAENDDSQGGEFPGRRLTRRDYRRDPESRLEVLLGGSGASDERLRAGNGQLSASIGYYITDEILLAVRQLGSTSKSGSGSERLWDGATRFAADYHFPLENVYPQVTPYVGVNIGYLYGDSVTETMAAGPEVGLKYYVKPDVFLQLGVEYDFTFKSSDRLDRAFENGSFFYGLGFGVCFR